MCSYPTAATQPIPSSSAQGAAQPTPPNLLIVVFLGGGSRRSRPLLADVSHEPPVTPPHPIKPLRTPKHQPLCRRQVTLLPPTSSPCHDPELKSSRSWRPCGQRLQQAAPACPGALRPHLLPPHRQMQAHEPVSPADDKFRRRLRLQPQRASERFVVAVLPQARSTTLAPSSSAP